MEAEAIGIYNAGRQIAWLRKLITELGEPPKVPLTLFADNKPAITVLTEQASFNKGKTLSVDVLKTRERIESGEMVIKYIESAENVADILTKALPQATHDKHVASMNLGRVSVTPPADTTATTEYHSASDA